MYYAAELLSLLSLGLSKVTLALFIRTLTPDPLQRRLNRGFVALAGIWTIAACLTLGIRCGKDIHGF